jgi:hypothetical protein
MGIFGIIICGLIFALIINPAIHLFRAYSRARREYERSAQAAREAAAKEAAKEAASRHFAQADSEYVDFEEVDADDAHAGGNDIDEEIYIDQELDDRISDAEWEEIDE